MEADLEAASQGAASTKMSSMYSYISLILGCVYITMAEVHLRSQCIYFEAYAFCMILGCCLISLGCLGLVYSLISTYTERRRNIAESILELLIAALLAVIVLVPSFIIAFLLKPGVPECMFEITLFNGAYFFTGAFLNLGVLSVFFGVLSVIKKCRPDE